MDHAFDVIIIGGGPAGIMAAGRAAEAGAEVLLLEKNKTLGKKLLITGKGRCNLSKAEFDPKALSEKYGREGAFLLSALSVFGVEKTIDFFNKKGLATKIEQGKRVFPKSDSARDVLRLLLNYLREGKVRIMTGLEVEKFILSKKRIAKIVSKGGQELTARNYVLAVGGKSFPGTGSVGDGYYWLEKMGHKIEKPRPALVPVRIKENWPKKLQGLSLKNVELTVFQKNKKQDCRFGEMLFSHFGLSGPIVLDLSSKIGELLQKGEVKLALDLKPALDFATLDKRLQSDFAKYGKKLFKNSLDDLLPQKMIPVVIEFSGISPFKKTNEINREERHKLARLLKNMEMQAAGLLGFNMAIITSGGLSLKEIDAKTMKSKLIDNLFLAGEIINLHGPTGGYNLQLCWSTGYLAGKSAAPLPVHD
jgi:predicted Rossmann fold flavoprotein